MENIIYPNNTFDFTKLDLAHPTSIQGGAYFTKIEYNKKPLYIQTTESLTKQGFVKTGKKYYCDLLFDRTADDIIHWFENLETRCQQLIFEKRDAWFQNSLEEIDIENAFNSTIRLYKSGKFYLLRTNIKTLNGVQTIKIYDEYESNLDMESITNDTRIISILEIQGIKFTSRNFQIEIELKQVMVLSNINKQFENCLIKTNTALIQEQPKDVENTELLTKDLLTKDLEESTESNILLDPIDFSFDNSTSHLTKGLLDGFSNDDIMNVNKDLNSDTLNDIENNIENNISNDIKDDLFIDKDNDPLDINIEDIPEVDGNVDLKEMELLEFPLEDNLETIQLKKPTQIYFELYKEAKKKAKEAKKNAIIAYLEAKNIKKTYMLENLDDSDTEFDAEIDEVSESELEEFD